ncbi:hypothetical protein [Marinilactibacillus kalidii]|uniref:hypothetical protein n=1 Tax=Marinilactibacillus kalidii TaxID=2820274 RepID=UPI001ABEB3CD|nr:hypothetical protein [Marinilactibacillus kalidii]
MNQKHKLFFPLLGFCIPFGYLAMWIDLTIGNMFFYFLTLSLLIGLGVLTDQLSGLISTFVGNGFSLFSSILFIYFTGLIEQHWYFKPFSTVGFVIFLSIITLLIQLLLIRVIFKKRIVTKKNSKQTNNRCLLGLSGLLLGIF